MKTLQQVEPRIDLFNAPASAGVSTGDANHHFVITQPGSYYLSGNLSVTKASGISIAAAGVTLDLNGFQASRGSGSGGVGILVRATANQARVKNGSVTGFTNGIIALEETIDSKVQTARGGIVSQITVFDCGSSGISAGDGWQLEACSAYSNATGLRVGRGGTMTRCVAIENTSTGIVASTGAVISDCTASSNLGAGSAVLSGSTISRCAARENGGVGFSIIDGATIVDSSAFGNTSHGISLSGVSGSVVRGNLASRNGFNVAAEAAGIRASNGDNRIEGNNCVQNDRGIQVTNAGNLIVKNSASGNDLNNYQIAAGNRYGVILDLTAADAAAGNGDDAAGTLTTTTNPWANFAY